MIKDSDKRKVWTSKLGNKRYVVKQVIEKEVDKQVDAELNAMRLIGQNPYAGLKPSRFIYYRHGEPG